MGNNGGNGTAGCAATVQCLNACSQGDTSCENACVAAASAMPMQLLDSAIACIDKACPSTSGGVCDTAANGYSQTKCGNVCVDTTSDPGNCGGCNKACKTGQTCQAGKCTSAMNGMTGCNGAVNCLNNCAAGNTSCERACTAKTTTQGKQLLNGLLQCLSSACPSTKGGVCDSTSFNYIPTKCNSFYSKAQTGTGKCVSALKACENSLP